MGKPSIEQYFFNPPSKLSRMGEMVKAKSWSEKFNIKLSEMDNCMVRIYSQIGYFFLNNSKVDGFMPSERIKTALELTLEEFPELAGRLEVKENGCLEVNCSNQGAEWVETTSDDSELLRNLANEEFPQEKIPEGLFSPPAGNDGPLLKVQLTRFPDGSLILCIALHHSITDGGGIFRFVKCWSDRARGIHNVQPMSDRSLLLSNGKQSTQEHNEYNVRKFSPEEIAAMMEVMGKPKSAHIFRLSKDAAAKLKADAVEEQKAENTLARITSTNDALSALVWCAAVRARGTNEGPTMLGMACNGRNRLEPPLPETYFGNVNYFVTATLEVSELGLGKASAKVREGVDGMDNERMRDTVNWIAAQTDRSSILPGFNPIGRDFSMTNWSTFPVYDADFGNGPPEAVRLPVREFDGLAVVFPGPPGNETELQVAIGLVSDAMQKFKEDPMVKKYLKA